MRSFYRSIFFVFFAAVCLGAPRLACADIEKRVALVIGNGAYTVAPALPNPATDAKAVAAAFRRLGFEVIDGYDLTIGEMRAKLAEFSRAIPESKAAIVYYAGHGVSMDEENYLLPVDLALKTPTDLDLNAISLSLVLKQMKREERVNVVILDACRDNPFAAELARTKTRAAIADRGLTRVDSELAKGTLLAYASDPKSVALDGKPGEHSPFTEALLDHIEDPGVSIDTVMNRVRTEVWTETKNRQMPWVNTSIIGEFALNPQVEANAVHVASLPPPDNDVKTEGDSTRVIAVTPAGAGPPLAGNSLNADRLAQENRMWQSAEHGNSSEDYQAYLDAYPTGVYARMAKSRIARLEDKPEVKGAAAVVSSPDAGSAKNETGNAQTEQALHLDPKKRKDVALRLQALDYDPGKITGAFSDKTRGAIVEWQNAHEYQPTGWLGPLQYLALIEESEEPYQRKLSAGAGGSAHRGRPERAASRSMAPAPRHYVAAPQRHYRHAYQPARQPQGDSGGAAFMGGLMGGAIGGIVGRRF